MFLTLSVFFTCLVIYKNFLNYYFLFLDPTSSVNLLSLFFNFENTMEDNLSRGLVSTSKQYENGKLILMQKYYLLWTEIV